MQWVAKATLTLAAVLLVATPGCDSAGQPKRVRAFAPSGSLIGEWRTHSHIMRYSSDGDYCFYDDATGERVIIRGVVVIEGLPR